METKTCSMCKKTKLLSEFFRDKTQKDGHHSHCKKCDYSIPRRGVLPQRKNQKRPKDLEALKQYIKAYKKEYRQRPKSKIADRGHKRKYLARLRASSPEYRKYKSMHDKKYHQTQKGKITRAKSNFRRRASEDKASLNKEEWNKILDAFSHACAYCLIPFDDQVSPVTVDHFIPLFRGGATVATNIVPACLHCNSSKQAKMPQEWCSETQLSRVLGILATLSF